MTYEEAYKILTEHTRNYVPVCDSEALEVAIKAVGLRIEKKPVRLCANNREPLCPNCGFFVSEYEDTNNCGVCGQVLDWSDTK